MKLILIWVSACLIIGVGGGFYYLNRPSVISAKNEKILTSATPNPAAKLTNKSFTNGGHKYSFIFYSDALVSTGALASKAGQQAILARPGHTQTSYVIFASPIDDAHAANRTDCGTRTSSDVVFTVAVSGATVSVCRGTGTIANAIYTMDVRQTGTWHQITFFDNALVDLTPHIANIKPILASLVIE